MIPGHMGEFGLIQNIPFPLLMQNTEEGKMKAGGPESDHVSVC